MAMKVAIIPKYMTVKNKKRKNKTLQEFQFTMYVPEKK